MTAPGSRNTSTTLSQWLSDGVACLRDLPIFLFGAAAYLKTGTTPERAYQHMIRLHCRTRGYSNDLLHQVVKTCRPPYEFPHANGVLGNLSADGLGTIASEIDTKGYYIFPTPLCPEVCDRLTSFALSACCRPRPRRDGVPELTRYDRKHPVAETYHFPEQTLLAHTDVQRLMSDWSILSVAQAYLQCQPVLDIVTMWWSTAFSQDANAECAQLYHFDMDRIKWLKFFFYLTDVTSLTGSHWYVSKSHRRNGQPRQLLRQGYARISDEEVADYYPAEHFVELTGKRGTIIAEDTRGFHKGKPPVCGDRLMLQLEFCDSLFGTRYEKSRLHGQYDPSLLQRAREYPRMYSKYALEAETSPPSAAQ